MKITLSPRRSGDTTRLANLVKDDKNAFFVTFSEDEADRVSEEFDIPRNRCLTIIKFLQNRGIDLSKTIAPVAYIDNAHFWIYREFSHPCFEIKEIVIKEPQRKSAD